MSVRSLRVRPSTRRCGLRTNITLPEPGRCLALSADGTRCAVSFGDYGIVRIYDINSGSQQAELQVPSRQRLFQLEFSRDGKRLIAAGGNGTTILWNLDKPPDQAVTALKGHEGDVRFAAFLADGQTLITGGEDRTIRVWRLPGPG